MNDDPMNLGHYIRGLRKKQGLTLRELARQLGKSAAFVSDVELNRRRPGKASWEKWAQILGADLREFENKAVRRPCPDCPLRGKV